MADFIPAPRDMAIQYNRYRCANEKCNVRFEAPILVHAPIEIVVQMMKMTRCPRCGSRKIYMGKQRTLAEDKIERRPGSVEERFRDWEVNGETGISSRALGGFMTGKRRPPGDTVPRDLDDFRRCALLLDRIPEWEPRMAEMSSLGGHWEQLAPRFSEMLTIYRTEAPGFDKSAPGLAGMFDYDGR